MEDEKISSNENSKLIMTQKNNLLSMPEPLNPLQAENFSNLTLLDSIKSISAKTILKLKSISSPNNTIDMLANCILLLFNKSLPKTFPWEQVSILFSNPGVAISQIRKTEENIRSKTIQNSAIIKISQWILQINKEDINSHPLHKELTIFLNYLKETSEFYLKIWPDSLEIQENPKRKFKIPQSLKKIEENELQQQINREKKALQEMKYKERLLKWEEERNIKKELKLEQLREFQREFNFSKSIEDEYRKTKEAKKKEEKLKIFSSKTRNFSCNKLKK